MTRYLAVFPGGTPITLEGSTLTAAHADLADRCQAAGYRTAGLISTATGGHTEITRGDRQFGVTIQKEKK